MSATDMSANDGPRMPEGQPRSSGQLDTSGPPLNETLKDRIKKSRVKYQHGQTLEISIPGWDYLVGVFRAIDDHEEYEGVIERANAAISSEREATLFMAIESLLQSNVKILARIDEQDVELTQDGVPVTLGLSLHHYLEMDQDPESGAETDRQAMFELFPTTRSIVDTFLQLEAFSRTASQRSDTRLQGN